MGNACFEGLKPRAGLPQPSRLRRVLKWSGLILCGLCLLGYPASYGRLVGVWAAGPSIFPGIGVGQGLLHVAIPTDWRAVKDIWFSWQEVPPPPLYGSWFDCYWGSGALQLACPLWCVFLALAIPTAWLWRRDSKARHPPGHCRNCGYNLTGNVSGICPECETPVEGRREGGEAGRQGGGETAGG